MLASSLKVLALAALSLSPLAAAQDATAQKLGWSGTLANTDGGLAGTVTVADAKTLRIDNYKLEDASAPALYWWGAVDANLKGGFRISQEQVTKASPSATQLTIALDAGKTTADFVTVGLWCEHFSANFGQATLKPGDGNSSSTAPSPSTTAGSSSSPSNSAKTNAGVAAGTSAVTVGAFAAAALFASWMA